MATLNQINANRENATHSTGPTTDAGKQTCSQNSRKHGLASSQIIIPGESEEEFNAFLADLLDEHQPETVTETLCVQDMAKHQWLKDRAIRFQNDMIGNTFAGVDKTAPLLGIFFRYQTTNERAYQRAFANLQTLRKARLAERKAEIGSASQNSSQTTAQPSSDDAAVLETMKKTNPTVEEILEMMRRGWFFNVTTGSYEWIGDENEDEDGQEDEQEDAAETTEPGQPTENEALETE